MHSEDRLYLLVSYVCWLANGGLDGINVDKCLNSPFSYAFDIFLSMAKVFNRLTFCYFYVNAWIYPWSSLYFLHFSRWSQQSFFSREFSVKIRQIGCSFHCLFLMHMFTEVCWNLIWNCPNWWFLLCSTYSLISIPFS